MPHRAPPSPPSLHLPPTLPLPPGFSCGLIFHQLLRNKLLSIIGLFPLGPGPVFLASSSPSASPHSIQHCARHRSACQPLNRRGHSVPWSALSHRQSHWPTWPETNSPNPQVREGQRASLQGRFGENGGELVTRSDPSQPPIPSSQASYCPVTEEWFIQVPKTAQQKDFFINRTVPPETQVATWTGPRRRTDGDTWMCRLRCLGWDPSWQNPCAPHPTC